jgi:hypothetical protein
VISTWKIWYVRPASVHTPPLAAERAVSSTMALQPLSPLGGWLGWGVATIDGAADGEADGIGDAGAADGEGDELGLAGAGEGEDDGDAEAEPQSMEATVMVAGKADFQM